MKHRFFALIISLSIIFLSSPTIYAAIDDLTFEQYGIIRFETGKEILLFKGYSWEQDWEQGYEIDFSGRVYNEAQNLDYSLYAIPDEPLKLSFTWDNPLFYATYSEGVRLSFPNIKLGFDESQVKGFYFKTSGDNLSYFRGTETYIPRTVLQSVMSENQNTFYLYDIPSSGDIVEHSEIIMLDGEVLTPMQDYHLNYLTGKLQMFIPLELNMTIEAKFLFIITNEELANVQGELIEGGVLSGQLYSSTANAYYIQRGEGKHLVKGASAAVFEGPVSIEAEWATSTEQSETELGTVTGNAYNLNSNYADEIINLTYQMRNLDPGFKEIGVNSFTTGKSTIFDLGYQVEKDLKFRLNLTNYEVEQDSEIRKTTSKMGAVDYEFAENHFAHFTMNNKKRSLDDTSYESNDVSLGYSYNTRLLALTFSQSLEAPENRSFLFKISKRPFFFESKYNVEDLWEGKRHMVNIQSDYHPTRELGFNTFIDYSHPFDAEKGNLRFHLNSNWRPSDIWSTNAGYIYFNHATFKNDTRRYSFGTNYQKDSTNSNTNAILSIFESETVKSHDLDTSLQANIQLGSHYYVGYQMLHTMFQEYMKDYKRFNQKNFKHSQSLALIYRWADNYSLTGTLGYTNNGTAIADTWSYSGGKSAGLAFSYQWSEFNNEVMAEAETQVPEEELEQYEGRDSHQRDTTPEESTERNDDGRQHEVGETPEDDENLHNDERPSLDLANEEPTLTQIPGRAEKTEKDFGKEVTFGIEYNETDRAPYTMLYGRIMYPFPWLTIDHRSSISKLNTGSINKAMVRNHLTFPNIWRITPKLNYDLTYLPSEKTAEGRPTRTTDSKALEGEEITEVKKEKIAAVLEYKWAEKRYIYLEVNRINLILSDNLNLNNAYLGVHTGVKIEF